MNGEPGAIHPLEPGEYVARTAGLAIGVVGWPSASAAGCVGYAIGQTEQLTVYATGGNLGAFGPAWSKWQASNGNSFTLPVSSGSTFALVAQQTGGGLHQVDAPISFYWVTLSQAEGAEAFERTGPPPELELLPEPSGSGDAEQAEG